MLRTCDRCFHGLGMYGCFLLVIALTNVVAADETVDETVLMQNQQTSVRNRGRFRTRMPAQGCLEICADGLDKIEHGLGSIIREHPLTVGATSQRAVVFGVNPGATASRSLQVALTKIALTFNESWQVFGKWIVTWPG